MALYLVDTNVLLRFVNVEAELYETIYNALDVLVERQNEVAIVPQNLYEFWAVATRPPSANGFGWSVQRTRAQLDTLRQRFKLLNDTPDLFSTWLELVTRFEVKGKQVHDACLVAAMQTHSVKNLLTLNIKDFERYSEIELIHPEEISNEP